MSSQLPPGTNLCDVPSGKPPEGHTPDFKHPSPALTGTLIGVSATLIAWATVFVGLRIFTNRKRMAVGDWFALVGWLLALGYNSILLSFAKYFRHSWDMPVCWYTSTYIKQLYAQGVMLGPSIFFSKVAIFLLYLQLFKRRKPIRWAVYVGIFITTLVYWAGIGIESYFCAAHPGETWDPLKNSPESRRCPKTIYWGIVQGAFAILIDLYIFILPIPIIVRLKMTTKRKVQVLAVFMTAALGIAASVCAEVFRVRLLFKSDDEQWRQSQQLICVVVENWIALVVSCMPAIAAFGRKYVSESELYLSLRTRLMDWTGVTSYQTSNDGTVTFDTRHISGSTMTRTATLDTRHTSARTVTWGTRHTSGGTVMGSPRFDTRLGSGATMVGRPSQLIRKDSLFSTDSSSEGSRTPVEHTE